MLSCQHNREIKKLLSLAHCYFCIMFGEINKKNSIERQILFVSCFQYCQIVREIQLLLNTIIIITNIMTLNGLTRRSELCYL